MLEHFAERSRALRLADFADLLRGQVALGGPGVAAAQFADFALLQKLLPVLDHFEMAQAAAKTAAGDKLESLQAGIAMIQQQLKSILADTGLEEIDASGKAFDPTLHEAVSMMETADLPEGQVVQQIRKGYRLRERLLRPAAVIVARKPSAAAVT